MQKAKKIPESMRPKLYRAIIAIACVAAIFVFCTIYFRSNIVPTVMDSSVAQMRAIATNAVNLAATTVLNDGVTYDSLFEVVKDKNDKITMIKANSPQINKIAREIANLAQANLDGLGTQEINISAGTFTGLALLMGFGPDVTIKITPIGMASCDFVSYFQAAGINQTLHKIYIDVYADVSIVTPIDQPTIQVKVEVLVCENLIVGEIPQTYLTANGSNGMLNLNT